MADRKLPLDGIRIADFSRLLPGPWCTQMLADLGAEVIKVERPDGDPSRHNPPLYNSESVYFCSVNGGKTSLALDLSTPEGRSAAHALISDADVLVESYGRGGAEKLDVHWDRANALNARLIYCSLTGFGQTGTLAQIAGHDLAIQAATGLLSLADTPAPAFQAADYAAATMAVIAIMGALRSRDRDGQGAYLDVAMFDALFGMGNIGLASALGRHAGGPGTPTMEVWGGNPRYRTYTTRDGFVGREDGDDGQGQSGHYGPDLVTVMTQAVGCEGLSEELCAIAMARQPSLMALVRKIEVGASD